MITHVATCKVLLVQDGEVVLTHNHSDTGRVVPIIASLLMDGAPTCYIAGTNLYSSLAELNVLMQETVPGWRMRIANRRRHAFSVNGEARIVGKFFVDYFCIDEKRGRRGERVPRKRFDVLNLDLLFEKPSKDPHTQLEMALSILELCEKRGIAVRNTKGSIGSALLRKSPEWQRGRHSAPKFVNDQARKYLPGNFYSVSQKLNRKSLILPHCYYLDQSSAHHNIARSVPVPHPHTLRARGNFKQALKGEGKKWVDVKSPTGIAIMKGEHIGLVCCHLLVSTIGPSVSHLYPPWAQTKGTKDVWLWTPEMRLLENDPKFDIQYFTCALSSTHSDPVLPEYSTWALDELRTDPVRAPHKKGALLAAYGMLAFNGSNRHIYRYWGGENSRYKVDIPLAGRVGESRITIPQHVELSTVNVVARGIIESETRTRSIEYARQLHAQGYHVPQIYADAVLVETDQLPLWVPDGWRVSHSLTHVSIPRPNAIVSDQVVKLPGVAGSEQDREWERRREDARRPLLLAS